MEIPYSVELGRANTCASSRSNSRCTGEELQVYNPGFPDLSSVGFNNKARSYNCAAV